MAFPAKVAGAGSVNLSGALKASAQANAGANVQVAAGANVNVAGGVNAQAGVAVNANANGNVAAKANVQGSVSVKAVAGAQVAVKVGNNKPTANSARNPDPAHVALFRIELDGITAAEFLECSGLKNSTEVVEYYEGGENTHMHKFIGNTKYPNITLKKGVTANSKTIWEWRNAITSNQKPLFKNGAIILLNDRMQEICRWNFKNGWPCRWDGPELKAGNNALAVEVLEIAHDGFAVVANAMEKAF